jgi:hypothetical protein
MVTIHVARAGADVRHRPTVDADLAAPIAVLADPEFAQRLNNLGYDMVEGSRLRRPTEHGEAFIDLIAPAPASGALHNQPAGRFRVDRFPGIQYVLNEPPVMVDIDAARLEGSPSPPSGSRCRPWLLRSSSKLSPRGVGRRTRTTSTDSSSSPTGPIPPWPRRHATISTSHAPPNTRTDPFLTGSSQHT